MHYRIIHHEKEGPIEQASSYDIKRSVDQLE